MPRCPVCETGYSDELDECPQCAVADGPAVTCDACGHESHSAEVCPACGKLHTPTVCAEHVDRAAAARCVLCGRAVCDDCRKADRRMALCAEHETVPVIEGWAQVYTTTTVMEAQLLRDNLLAEGIDAQVYSQRDSIFSVDLGELSIVRILVPVWEYQPALQLMRDHMDSEGEVVFACPGCGEAYEQDARECSTCGLALA